MNKEAIQARIDEYQVEMTSIREQVEKIRREAEGRLNALQGAIDDCNYWLAKFDEIGSDDSDTPQ